MVSLSKRAETSLRDTLPEIVKGYIHSELICNKDIVWQVKMYRIVSSKQSVKYKYFICLEDIYKQ